MDKRTQLAVLLVALILGGNLAYTARHQKQKLAAQRAANPTTTAPAPPSAAAPQAANGAPTATGSAVNPGTIGTPQIPTGGTLGPFTAADASAGDLVVETPLQRLRISRAGGVVRELELPEFAMSGSKQPVELAPEVFATDPSRNRRAMTVRVAGADWDLSQARFDNAAAEFAGGAPLVLAAGSGPRTFELRCEATGGGAVVKSFTIDPDRYDFEVAVRHEPGPGLPKIDSYTISWMTGMPWTEGNIKEDEQRFKVMAAVDQQLIRKRPGDFRKVESETAAGTVRWTAMQSKYFLVGLIPAVPQPGTVELVGESRTQWMGMRIAQPTPWRNGPDVYRIYAGPVEYDRIHALGVGLDAAVELGYRWIRPISQLLLHFMQFLNKYIPNYGIIIIIVSMLAKLVFWPLTDRSMKSMRRMAELQPRMEEIRRRYKDDPKAMNEQVMSMYREQKVNPVGGCMPILIQTPMFFALFAVLQSNIELRNAPFFAWIDNLAGPDVLYKLPTSLPVIGNHISLLPLIMGGTMLWQSAIGSPMGGAPPSGAMGQQQFIMKWVMPIMMTFFFYKMPSGLVLYWIVNTVMGIAQQMQINRKFGPAPAVVAAAPQNEGRATHATRPDRVHGTERGGSSGERSGRVGGQGR